MHGNANRLILEVDRLCSRIELSDEARTTVEQTMEIIRRRCKAMPLLRPSNIRKKAVYWWDDNIAALRRDSAPAAEVHWSQTRPAADEMRAYKEAKKSPKKAITRQELRAGVNP